MAESCTYNPRNHWTVKVSIFAASVISLSWFFAGWRQVVEAQTLGHWLLLAGALVLTLLLVGLQGYWIYFEESAKGTLRKRIKIYETIHDALEKRRSGDCCKEETHKHA